MTETIDKMKFATIVFSMVVSTAITTTLAVFPALVDTSGIFHRMKCEASSEQGRAAFLSGKPKQAPAGMSEEETMYWLAGWESGKRFE